MEACAGDENLAADDDKTLLRAISRALGQAGFEVDTAANAEEAMVCVTRETYDVALVDYMLGRDNGLEVLGTLASIQPKCARAVMTSHRDLRQPRRSTWVRLSWSFSNEG